MNLDYRLGTAMTDREWVHAQKGWWSDWSTGFAYSLRIKSVSFGDLTGDGREEAAIERFERTGGSGDFSYVDIVTLAGHQPVILDRLGGGDRCDGSIVRVAILDGSLYLCVWAKNMKGSPCGATRLERWRWNNEDGRMELISDELTDCRYKNTEPRNHKNTEAP
jgi:hypothetical protein